MASDENDDSFAHVLKNQIKVLRKQLEKDKSDARAARWASAGSPTIDIRNASSGPFLPPPKLEAAELARADIEQSTQVAGLSGAGRLVTF